ncbi:acyltransferase [Ilumatobacter sp.]|uniref:acyltransferase n=1 Tax=Ilumatobacter sp. TaxID=1967498 RepID=UPI003B528B43
MAPRLTSINQFKGLRRRVVDARKWWLRSVWGMDIADSVELSMSAKLDRNFPRGVHIGAHSYVAFEARILCHDRTRGLYLHTRIGENCFIGGRSLILPGVEIGDGCVVGAGAIVTKSVPAGSIVAGNPATIVRTDIEVGPYGRFPDADANTLRLKAEGKF